ncbi:MAG: hypothetical protein AB7T63_18215 [Planctomycetota bacterium]
MLRTRFALALAALLGLPLATAAPLVGEDNDCHRLGMEVTCTVEPSKVILVGDPFEVSATVRNTGNIALANVTFALAGGEGIMHVGGDELRIQIPKLEAGETRQITSRFMSDGVGERRVNASAREERGWAAAGCICGVLIKGLPALQVEMVDVDSARQPKGIFDEGEEFIYILQVENDVGTANTPELKVVWELPPELEFVSGTGDRGAIITGSGRSAESSGFDLRPNQVQNFDLVVRVKSVPPTNLVQARAAVVTAAGGQELATETESTTVKKVGQ